MYFMEVGKQQVSLAGKPLTNHSDKKKKEINGIL